MAVPDSTSPSTIAGAPGHVRLVGDFLNTLERQVAEESLETPAELHSWFVERGLLGPEDHLTSGDLAVARSVREGLRNALLAHAGHQPDAAATGSLNRALAAVDLRVELTRDGHPRLVPAATSGPLQKALAAILEAMRQSTEDQTWERLKVCDRDSCRWAFYDTSRNRAGRWCSMAGCGNHIKMKRAYATRKANRG